MTQATIHFFMLKTESIWIQQSATLDFGFQLLKSNIDIDNGFLMVRMKFIKDTAYTLELPHLLRQWLLDTQGKIYPIASVVWMETLGPMHNVHDTVIHVLHKNNQINVVDIPALKQMTHRTFRETPSVEQLYLVPSVPPPPPAKVVGPMDKWVTKKVLPANE